MGPEARGGLAVRRARVVPGHRASPGGPAAPEGPAHPEGLRDRLRRAHQQVHGSPPGRWDRRAPRDRSRPRGPADRGLRVRPEGRAGPFRPSDRPLPVCPPSVRDCGSSPHWESMCSSDRHFACRVVPLPVPGRRVTRVCWWIAPRSIRGGCATRRCRRPLRARADRRRGARAVIRARGARCCRWCCGRPRMSACGPRREVCERSRASDIDQRRWSCASTARCGTEFPGLGNGVEGLDGSHRSPP